MGRYYYHDDSGAFFNGFCYHCHCGFKTDSFMGIQSHIRKHKKFQELIDQRVQTTLLQWVFDPVTGKPTLTNIECKIKHCS